MSNAATIAPKKNANAIGVAATIPAPVAHTVAAGADAYWTALASGAENSDLYLSIMSGAPLSSTMLVAAAR